MSPGPQRARPLLLFSPAPDLRAEARRALAAAGPVRISSSWAAFRKRATGSLCAVAVLPGARGEEEHAEELAALRSAAPVVPLVLVTREDPETLRTLAPVPVDEVVWLGEMPEALPPAARRAVARGWRRRMSWAFGLSAGVPRVLREALALAARAGVPLRSVSALAEAAGADRRTLWRAWRRATGGKGRAGSRRCSAGSSSFAPCASGTAACRGRRWPIGSRSECRPSAGPPGASWIWTSGDSAAVGSPPWPRVSNDVF